MRDANFVTCSDADGFRAGAGRARENERIWDALLPILVHVHVFGEKPSATFPSSKNKSTVTKYTIPIVLDMSMELYLPINMKIADTEFCIEIEEATEMQNSQF